MADDTMPDAPELKGLPEQPPVDEGASGSADEADDGREAGTDIDETATDDLSVQGGE